MTGMPMFCPQCGVVQSDDLRFCKSCGANLGAVRQVVATRETGEPFDWGRTWVAEMFMSATEKKRRKEEMERQRGITPEMKRYTEIKAGVITGCVGTGLAILLYVLMEGIIRSGNVTQGAAEILSRLWVVGVIPLFVGIALVINGLLVSKKLVEIGRQERRTGPWEAEPRSEQNALPEAGPTAFMPAGFSVTEDATRHLSQTPQRREAADKT